MRATLNAESRKGIGLTTAPIRLTFKNLSDGVTGLRICFYQRNVAADIDEPVVAWEVIESPGKGGTCSFDFPQQMQVTVRDRWGNVMPVVDAVPGQAFEIAQTPNGEILRELGNATCPTEVQINNNMEHGVFDAWVYKDGRVLAGTSFVHPGSMAAFEFRPSIGVGADSEVRQGELIYPEKLSQAIKEFSLEGIASATITMYGGGAGTQEQALTFTMEDVVYV